MNNLDAGQKVNFKIIPDKRAGKSSVGNLKRRLSSQRGRASLPS